VASGDDAVLPNHENGRDRQNPAGSALVEGRIPAGALDHARHLLVYPNREVERQRIAAADVGHEREGAASLFA